MTGTLVAEIGQVRRLLSEASDWLKTPDSASVSSCADCLDQAVDRLLVFEVHAQRADPVERPILLSQMHELRRELHQVGALLAQAAQLQIGWAQLLGAVPTRYDSQGQTVEAPVCSVKVEG